MGGTEYWQTSKSVEWYTPKWIFETLNCEFDLDVCSPGKDKCYTPSKRHIVLPENGLISKWDGFVWMNPPFGKRNNAWFNKFAEHKNGIAIVPVNQLNTVKFNNIIKAIECISVIKGRVNFINGADQSNAAPTQGMMLLGAGQKAKSILAMCNIGQVWYPLRKEAI